MPNHQSTIVQLIADKCPNGVDFKRIAEVCNINRGRVVSKDYLRNNVGQYPVYSSQTANNGIFGLINTFDYNGEYVTWTTDGANAGTIFYRNGKFSITNVCGLLKPKHNELNAKYLSYILGITAKFYVSSGMGNPKLMSNVLAGIKIPIPPLPIQQEIVKILDSFTELEAELEARKKQYEYYRDEMLNIKDVGYKTLGEIGELIRGNGLPKSDFTESGVGCIHYGQIYTYYGTYTDKTKSFVSEETAKKLKKAQTGDVIITNTSENLEDVGKAVVWCGKGEIVTGGHATIFKSKKVTGKYFAYYTQTKMFFDAKRKYAKDTKVIDVSATDMSKIKIPVPPIEEQEKIVSILDKFDALVNNISIGLPAELKARIQQYEYYQGKLLTFKEKEYAK